MLCLLLASLCAPALPAPSHSVQAPDHESPGPRSALLRGQESFAVVPIPDWVELAPLPAADELGDELLADGFAYLTVDHQLNTLLRPTECFHEVTWTVASPRGVQYGSQVEIEFDPSYEELLWHTVEVLRDGQTLPQLDVGRVQVLRREPALEESLYDGTLTALLFLEGIRPGDVVRTRYTLRGEHPAFSDRFADVFFLGEDDFAKRVSWRLLWHARRPLSVRSMEGAPEVEWRALDSGSGSEARWVLEGALPGGAELNAPGWFMGVPWVQLSDFADWGEVALWCLGLFECAEPSSGEFRELAAFVASETEGDPVESRIERALRFIQEEVRYLGLELGVGSYRPTAPDDVLARRFGDCKDKALLLVRLLEKLGIESQPALVSTQIDTRVNDWIPSPLAFDHVIVRIETPQGELWVDPTETLQGGALFERSPPPFAYALVLHPDSSGLTPLPAPLAQTDRIEFERVVTLSPADDSARLEIHTRQYGASADTARMFLQSLERTEIEKHFLEYHLASYPSARIASPMSSADDPERNVVRLVESYHVPDFLTRVGKAAIADFIPDELLNYLPEMPDPERSQPLELCHPLRIDHRTHVRLASDWNTPEESGSVENEWFHFSWDVDRVDDALNLTYSFESRRDHVVPERLAAFTRELERVDQRLEYRLTDEGDSGRMIVVASVLCAALSLGALGTLVGVTLWTRSRRAGENAADRVAP